MTTIKWDGIPAQYWPDTEKPWRVSWGLGVFEDFAAKEDAEAKREELDAERQLNPEVFNAVEET